MVVQCTKQMLTIISGQHIFHHVRDTHTACHAIRWIDMNSLKGTHKHTHTMPGAATYVLYFINVNARLRWRRMNNISRTSLLHAFTFQSFCPMYMRWPLYTMIAHMMPLLPAKHCCECGEFWKDDSRRNNMRYAWHLIFFSFLFFWLYCFRL